MTMKELMRPYLIADTLIRLGAKADGGYVAPSYTLKQSDVCYSYGIGDNITFDVDYVAHTGNPVHMYDHTVDIQPQDPKLIFHKEGLAGTKLFDCDNFLNHLKANGDEDKQVFIKMDCEGMEINWILNTDMKELSKSVIGMVIEFHWIHTNKEAFLQALQKLQQEYAIVHLHSNNYGSLIKGVPDVPELTFVRNSDYRLGGKVQRNYPVDGLDYPNNSNVVEHSIKYVEDPL